MRTKIKDIIKKDEHALEKIIGQPITIKGWVKTVRDQKAFAFVEVYDGSTFSGIQVVVNPIVSNYSDLLTKLATGASIVVEGMLVKSPGGKQKVEIQAEKVDVLGESDPASYPLQKKRHSFEFLRTIAHLRPRTNTIGSITRIRNALSFATHLFFQEKGFLYIHTPIITASDCEGGGELFQVTTLKADRLPMTKEGKVDYTQDFFEKPAYLTVSGQLNGEIYASALSDIYTFGPTFRAENSHTTRHLAEFWMIEPEMAFADIKDCIDNAESYLKYVIQYVLENCQEDIAFFDEWVEKGLKDRLKNVLETSFVRVTYTEAIDILKKSKKDFVFPVDWGIDLQSEHERYLCEEHFHKPIVVTDYPKEIKAFYMRDNEDGKTVAAMDILVPKIGEIVGGSQREERYGVLLQKIREKKLKEEDYWWYLELRKYGSVPHSGYGVGFERMIQFLTGIENIREAIPFPRSPGSITF